MQNIRTVWVASFLILCILMSVALSGAGAQTSDVIAVTLASRSVGAWGIDLNDRDLSVKPGDDFFMFQNGAWFAHTELNSKLVASAYWRDLRRLSPLRLNAILTELALKSAPPASAEAKASAFYRAFMDEKTTEAKGLAPLKPELDAIRAAKTKAQMAELMGRIAGPGTQRSPNKSFMPTNRAAFSVDIGQDQNNPNRYTVYIGQAGLGLPGTDYYSDPQLADIKAAYEAYIARMLSLIGWSNPEASAREVVSLETRIASASWSPKQMSDVVKTYNPMTVAELSKLAPDFNWREFLDGAELGRVRNVVIDAKSAFPVIARIYGETPTEVLQAQQAFALVERCALTLNASVFNAYNSFRTNVFRNLSAGAQPRWFYALNTLETSIGDILGALYVARYFSPASKLKAQEMAANLKSAFDARLQRLSWMSPATKAKAREKLARMKVNIGYPDKFEDYRGLVISDTDLYGDVTRAMAFNWQRRVSKLNQPFDRSNWIFTPQTVNYAYIATTNTLEIPAATLQPPFFDLKADEAVNYGAIGALIGLTIINGFDSQGRHYDMDGRMRDWWTREESEKFDVMAKQLSAQYSAIEPLPGVRVKGELLVNESIGDLGGLMIALDAYHLSLKGQPAPILNELTGDQRFFLGRAQMWRAKFDVPFIRNQLATGQNAPPFLRVNGPVRNIDAWYDAFNVKPGDKLYLAPEARVRIW